MIPRLRRTALAAALVLTPTLALAAPLERDLGQGLIYFRAHTLPADLPATSATTAKSPCVLDLRYAQGDAPAASALGAWLKFHATARTPVFVLVNPSLSPTLLAAFGEDSPDHVVLIGASTPDFQANIPLKISPEAERLAYDALEAGATVETLLAENPDKPRNDEAKLAKERLPDSSLAPADSANEAPPTTEKPAPAKPAPPPHDIALQRAVHLHRALLALKKL